MNNNLTAAEANEMGKTYRADMIDAVRNAQNERRRRNEARMAKTADACWTADRMSFDDELNAFVQRGKDAR